MAEKHTDYFTLSQLYIDGAHAAMQRMMQHYLQYQNLPASKPEIDKMAHDCQSMLGYMLILQHGQNGTKGDGGGI